MTVDVGVLVPALAGEVRAIENLALQISQRVIDARVDDSDRDTTTGGGLPHVIRVHGIEVPLPFAN
jgi:hypothetical protein